VRDAAETAGPKPFGVCAFTLLLGACAHGAAPVVGVSGAGEEARASAADAGAEAGVSRGNPLAQWASLGLEPASSARFVSKGHAADRWDAQVSSDRAGLDVLRGARGDVPVGTVFVMEHFERGGAAGGDGGADRGPVFAMEKRPPGFDPAGGDWRYVAVGASGEVKGDGVIEACAACHADAPHDHVFPIRGPAAPPVTTR
jgi:hypothetical protein